MMLALAAFAFPTRAGAQTLPTLRVAAAAADAFAEVHYGGYYDSVLSATQRQRDAREALRAAKAEREEFERMLEAVFAARVIVVRGGLSTRAGLQKAIQIDPLLAISYAQLVAASSSVAIAS
jgi:hypothetical protein